VCFSDEGTRVNVFFGKKKERMRIKIRAKKKKKYLDAHNRYKLKR
jgi:hypothetical protein